MGAAPRNLLVIMSDEHNPKIAGYAGHRIVSTPALDALAACGSRFTAAYTPSPICVPARASLATGLPVHRHRAWDNAIAYDGRLQGWAHALRKRGHHVASIGKLHYRGQPDEDYGFTESLLAMHITGGIGDVTHLVRDPDDIRTRGRISSPRRALGKAATPCMTGMSRRPPRSGCARPVLAGMYAPGCCSSRWGRRIFHLPHRLSITTVTSARICRGRSSTMRLSGRTTLCPHVRAAFGLLRALQGLGRLQRALAGYFGLVSFLDEQIGEILTVLSETGLADTRRVIYTSDHGDNLGARGLWGKATMCQESAGMPMLLAGEGVPVGAVCATPLTLCDASAAILDAVGASEAISELGLPGASLLDLANQPSQNRTVLSEFHTYGPDAFYMLRTLRHKYVCYVGAPPQLFDLEADPEELTDLGADPAHASLRAEFDARLRAILTPELADQQAKADQARTAEHYGGFEMLRRREKMAFTPPPTAKTH